MGATRRVVVGSKVGLHARPAALFVQAAGELPVRVTVAKEALEELAALAAKDLDAPDAG